MATLAALGLQIETGDVERGERALTKLDVAAKKVEAAKDRLAAASSRYQAVQARENASDFALRAAKASVTSASAALSAAQQRSTTLNNAAASAALANAKANNALAVATRAAAINQRMLFPQLLQIGQSVPLAFQAPLAFMQQFAFQSADIAQIYAGRGGVTAAISDSASMVGRFAARLGPIAVAAGVAALAMRGLQNDINAVSGASVGMGHLATAAAHELAASVMTVAAPAVDRLGYAVNRTSELVLGGIELMGNSIINSMVFAFDAVLAYWNHWPSEIGALFVSGVNKAIDAINGLVRQAVQGINGFSQAVNQHLPEFLQFGSIGTPGRIDGLENDFAGGQATLEAALDTAYAKFQNTPFSDYLDRVGQEAIELARAAAEAGDGIGGIGRAATQAGQPIDLLGQSLNAANDNMRNWSQIGSNAFSGFFAAVRNGTSVADAFESMWTRALDNVASRFLDLASNNLVNMLLGSFGGGFGGLGGFGGSSGIGLGPGTSLPVYHSGTNFVPETGPAILQRGEAVIPANMNRPGGFAPSQVELIVRVQNDGNLEAFVRNAASQEAAPVAVRVVNEKNAQFAQEQRRVRGTGRAT
ncbi:hypothetical protein ABWH92_12410 [Ahrensia marina]|uniref:hypothetical protein n=1 Tax=Ahrensia marina TaxID=1514904 RepID=UPI0035CF637F